MSDWIQSASAAITRYQETRDAEFLLAAVDPLQGAAPHRLGSEAARADARRQTLWLWMLVLAWIDAGLDPDFDPDDAALTRVSPPQTPEGRALLPGVDPSAIPDPAARAAYERAIEANQQKAQRRQEQWQLRAIDREATEGAERFVRRYYAATDADRAELGTTLEHARVSPARRERFEALLR